MTQQPVTQQTERFSATSGRVVGMIAIVLAAVVAVLSAVGEGGPSYDVIALMVLLGALAWVALVRPRIDLEPERLVLHTLFSTAEVPLRCIDSVDVRQVLVVRAGEHRLLSPAVGRTRRQLQQEARGPAGGRTRGARGIMGAAAGAARADASAATSYPLFVQERIRARVADARAQAGFREASGSAGPTQDAQVTRRPAVPEIVVLAASAVAFVVLVAT